MTSLPSTDEMYRVLVARDRSYEGLFYAAIRTTGIFCRPTCTARKPNAENVEYFASAREALLAGYRPCKRCHPMEINGAAPPWVGRLIEAVESAPGERMTDGDLRRMSIDPATARRYFKTHHGMTFHAYHRARRMGLALAEVRRGGDLTEAGLNCGYDSTSGFREAFARVFGEPPGRGRAMTCLRAHRLETPLGAMLAIAHEDGLCLLEFADRRGLQTQIDTLRRRLNAAIVPGENEYLEAIAEQLARYFEGELTQFDVPLVLPGTDFQCAVWDRLMRIPYGATDSYAAMARDLGRLGAQRAVGRANGDNRLAIIIPCHRVVRSDGSLCGYGGGLHRKKWLLDHERRHAPRRAGAASGPVPSVQLLQNVPA